ncbi:hypothetical protein [Curtobacterium sp. L1-20]|uniref:hypothetical protein n=1 Tax=Curtobacterium sp. L1-20 TaxID=3138181 RepID=UPI003B51C220
MSALDRLLLSAAIAMSPSPHRAIRREQWLADLRDARDLDLSPTALAFGALTTALFHRRTDHRSTWKDTMTVMPGTVRSAPLTVPVIPVLIAFAALSFLAGSVGLGLLQRYNGLLSSVPAILLTSFALTIVPGIAVGASILLTTGVPLRRRAIGTVVVLAVSALWWSVDTGFFNPPVSPAFTWGVIAAAWLAVWHVVLRRPGWTWALLLLPIAASVLVFPLANSLYGTQLALSMQAATATALEIVPFLVALIAGMIAGRSEQSAPHDAMVSSGGPHDIKG